MVRWRGGEMTGCGIRIRTGQHSHGGRENWKTKSGNSGIKGETKKGDLD